MITETKIKPGYKKTPVGIIPEDWEVKKLEDIGEVINGLTYSPKDRNENGTLVLRSSNIQNRALNFDDNVYVDTTKLKFNPVKENDILICVRNGSKSLILKFAGHGLNHKIMNFIRCQNVSKRAEKCFCIFGRMRQLKKRVGAQLFAI